MNREQVDARNSAAITRYARNIADTGGKAPKALLDELWSIAAAFAAGQVAQHANPAPVVATEATGTPAATPPPSSAHRTRARTRGGPK
jgi:hypothetical protein